MPMRRESGRASGTGPPKKTRKIRKVAQNKTTSSLGSNAAAAHGYKPTSKPIPKQTRGQKQDLRQRSAPSDREKEMAYALRMRRTQPAEAKRQGDIVRTEKKLKARYDLATGNYVRTNKRRFLPDEDVVIDPKTKKATTDITAATKQSGVKHAETVAPALKVLEQTTRGTKAVAGGVRAAIRGQGPVGILKAQKKGLVDNKGPMFGEVLHKDLKVPKPAAAAAGFALDIATDPTTYVTGGSGKVAVKGAEKAAKDAAKKAAAKGMSDAGVKTVQKAAAKKAVRQAGAKGERTGVTVKVAGKELPGVRTGSAAVGAGLKRVVPSRARTGARETVAHVRPQITPTGMTKAEHVLNRQTERRARAQRSRGVREAQALAEAHRGRLKPEEWEQVQHAIETRKLKNLPDHLRQPAIDIRSANRAALRERRAAGVSQGDVTSRPATIVRQPSSSLKAGEKPTKRLTATVSRPKREAGAPKEYMPHMRASLIEGEQEAAKAGAKGGTRKIGSTMKRQMNVPVREANERLGADERFSTNVPLVQANYRVQTANAVAGARMARDLGERAPKVTPKLDKHGDLDVRVPEGHSVYRLAGGKLDEVDEKELYSLASGKGKKHGRLVSLNKQQVDAFKKQFIDDRTAAGKGFDFVQGKWKRVATFTPGFHVRNMIGDTQMATLPPGAALPLPRNAAQAGKALKRMTSREAVLRREGVRAPRTDKTVKVAGKDTNLDEFLDGAINEGVIRSGMIARGIDDVAAEGRAEAGADVSKRTLKGLRNTAAGGKVAGAVRPVKKAAASVNRGMQNREDLMRLATYKHGLDRGLTKPEAADLASAFHIDYGDVTDFERKVARRAAPFYTFSARALPIHVKALVNTPGKIAAIEKARQELAYGMGLDDGWEGDTPEWKQRAIPFGVKIKGENVALDAALPVSMLNELPTSLSAKDYATEMWKFGTGLLTPAIKIPIEVGTNQSLFFRKPIKDPNTPYVSAPAWVKWLPEQVRNGLGVVEIVDKRSGKKVAGWDPWTNYAFRQLPGLATQFQQVTTQGALQSGRHDWQKWSGVAGVKADPIDPTTAAITKLFDKRNKIDMRLRQLGKQGQKGGKSSSNPEVRKLTKQLAGLDYQIYSNSVERGDAQPLRETAIPNPKLKKPRVVQRGLLKKGDKKAAAKKSGGGSGWGGAGSSGGSGW